MGNDISPISGLESHVLPVQPVTEQQCHWTIVNIALVKQTKKKQRYENEIRHKRHGGTCGLLLKTKQPKKV